MTDKKRSLLRFGVSILTLVLLVWITGVKELREVLLRVSFPYFILLLLVSFPLIWASCLKWQLFLAARGHAVSTMYLMRIYTISYYFNNFAPSSIGGDVARSLSLGSQVGSNRDAFISTFLERFTGLLAMAILSMIFIHWVPGIPLLLAQFVFLIGVICIAAALCIFSTQISAIVFPVVRNIAIRIGFVKVGRFVDSLYQSLDYVQGNRKLFVQAMYYSFLFHALTVLNVYVAALTIGWESVDILGLFVVVPLVLLVSMIPITPGSVGLQEGAFAYFLAQIGSTVSEGLGVGLVLRVKIFCIAIVGACLWALSPKSSGPKGKIAPESMG